MHPRTYRCGNCETDCCASATPHESRCRSAGVIDRPARRLAMRLLSRMSMVMVDSWANAAATNVAVERWPAIQEALLRWNLCVAYSVVAEQRQRRPLSVVGAADAAAEDVECRRRCLAICRDRRVAGDAPHHRLPCMRPIWRCFVDDRTDLLYQRFRSEWRQQRVAFAASVRAECSARDEQPALRSDRR